MYLEDRFFPRVWDGKRYWYPCFSELGVTYQNEDLPLTEENIKTLDWALGWHFPKSNKDNGLEFDNIVEQCTGLKDKNGKLIYENDVVELDDSIELVNAVIKWDGNDGCWNIEITDTIYTFDNLYGNEMQVIGTVHENPELLEQRNDD